MTVHVSDRVPRMHNTRYAVGTQTGHLTRTSGE